MLIALALVIILALVARRFAGFRSQRPAKFFALDPRFDPCRDLNGPIINRSQFHTFGIRVAELVATMRRVPA